MSDEYKDNKIETKSADSSSGGYAPPVEHIPAKEAPEQELYHAKSFWTKWVFSQDAKVIGVQYALTATAIGLIGLVLSWGMRLQLGYPETISFLGKSTYYKSVTKHGMIMVIYLLTALFLGGFGNYLIPLMVGARDMVFPYVNMVSYWMFLVAVLVLISSFFVPGGPTGAGWTLYPPQAILPGTPGSEYGIVLMLISLTLFVIGFTMGGLNYVITVLQARTRGMTLMRMPLTVWGIFTLWQQRSTNAHSNSFIGRHKTSAFPFMLEQSRSYPFTISKSEVISIWNSNERNSTNSEMVGLFSAQTEIFSTTSLPKIE